MAYVLQPGSSLASEVRRVAAERLDGAIDALAYIDEHTDTEAAVHDVRKRCKEVRALARLVRPSIGKQFGPFNAAVRDAADALSSIRDAHAVLSTFDDLVAATVRDADDSLDAVRAGHLAAAAEATASVQARDPRIDTAHRLLIEAREQIDGWTVADDIDSLASGIEACYQRGRQALHRARKHPTDRRLHEWRKAAKTLWYHMRLVAPAAPSVLDPLVASLDDLADALGDDHDLAVLVERLSDAPERFGGRHQVDHAVALARAQQDDLRRRAFRLGATIYAESPGAFARRISAYWACTTEEGPELATGSIAELARDELAGHSGHTGADGTVERERKYLVTEAPELATPGTVLRQGYLAVDRGVSVRVRDAAAEGCTLTVKAGRGAVRTELDWSISEAQFAAAWPHTLGRRVHKTRRRIPWGGAVIELDVFHDDLDGLVMAEVEFPSDEAMAAFREPGWFGREVTDDDAYTNASLAIHGLPAG